MPRNLECKARIDSLRKARSDCRKLNARPVAVLYQTDTFYQTSPERLKLREERGSEPALVYYRRPDSVSGGGKWSEYLRIPVRNPKRLKRRLGPRFVTVVKRRELYQFRNARIHLDAVKKLGSFIEFEVVSRGNVRADRALFGHLVRSFGVNASDMIAVAYADLLVSLKR